jgi:hypothetical protein
MTHLHAIGVLQPRRFDKKHLISSIPIYLKYPAACNPAYLVPINRKEAR